MEPLRAGGQGKARVRGASLLRNATFRLFMTLRAIWAPTALGVATLVLEDQGRVLPVRHGYNPGGRNFEWRPSLRAIGKLAFCRPGG